MSVLLCLSHLQSQFRLWNIRTLLRQEDTLWRKCAAPQGFHTSLQEVSHSAGKIRHTLQSTTIIELLHSFTIFSICSRGTSPPVGLLGLQRNTTLAFSVFYQPQINLSVSKTKSFSLSRGNATGSPPAIRVFILYIENVGQGYSTFSPFPQTLLLSAE